MPAGIFIDDEVLHDDQPAVEPLVTAGMIR